MSKIAEEKAIDAWAIYEYREHPKGLYHTCFVDGYKEGYEQAEKETIEKAAKWIRVHWREYIWGPDADGCIGFGLWENDFRKAMEEENGQSNAISAGALPEK